MYTSVSAYCMLIIYADDSVMRFSHRNPEVILQKLSEVIESFWTG